MVSGIGRDVAAKICYRALSVYMTPTTNYAGARQVAINAAKDLYGASSTQCAGVEAAFSAISVTGATCGSTPPPSTGGNLLQNPGFESGATAWSQTSGVISQDSTRAHSGSWLGWLDGYGASHTDTLSQSVTIPSATSATFPVAEDHHQRDNHDGGVRHAQGAGRLRHDDHDAGDVLEPQRLRLHPAVVQPDVVRWQTVTIKLVGVEDASLATSFLTDDFSLTTA